MIYIKNFAHVKFLIFTFEKYFFLLQLSFNPVTAMKTVTQALLSEFFHFLLEITITIIKNHIVLLRVKATHMQVWKLALSAGVATYYQIWHFIALENVHKYARVMQRRYVVVVGEWTYFTQTVSLDFFKNRYFPTTNSQRVLFYTIVCQQALAGEISCFAPNRNLL